MKHYSPQTRLRVCADPLAEYDAGKSTIACLVWKKPAGETRDNLFWLSANGSLEEAAARLYAALHEIDLMGYEEILAQDFPDEGLGQALNDRLRRAASK